MDFSQFWRLGSPRPRSQQIEFLVRSSFLKNHLLPEEPPSPCVPPWSRKKVSLVSSSSYKNTNPSAGAPILMTSPKPNLQKVPSPNITISELQLQYMKKDSQSINIKLKKWGSVNTQWITVQNYSPQQVHFNYINKCPEPLANSVSLRMNELIVCACSVAQSCSTFCNPADCSPPGFSGHGIFQARTLEWVAISFSSGSSQPRDQTQVSCGSCTGKWILYHTATWEAQLIN